MTFTKLLRITGDVNERGKDVEKDQLGIGMLALKGGYSFF